MSSTVVIPPADLFPTTGTGDAVLATSPTLVTPISASLTAPAATPLTLTGGSTGASLVLGQGTTVGDLTFTPTGSATAGTLVLSRRSASAATIATISYGADSSSLNQGPGYFFLGTNSAIPLVLGTTGLERARIPATGNLLIGTTTDMTGSGGLKIAGTTAATTTTSGALIVAGGVGVSGAGYFGGDVSIIGAAALDRTLTIQSLGAQYAQLKMNTNSSTANNFQILAESGGRVYFQQNNGAINTLQIESTGNATYSKKWNISDATSASSSTVGALTIGNGTAATNVAIGGGNVNAGGTITAGGNITTGADVNFPAGGYGLSYGVGSRQLEVVPGAIKIVSSSPSTGVGTGALQVAGGIYAGAASVFGGAVNSLGFVLNRTNNSGYYTGTSDNYGFTWTGTNGEMSTATGSMIFKPAATTALTLMSTAATFAGGTLTLAPAAAEATITAKGRATGTNPLATTSRGGVLGLTNLDTTDNNAEAITFQNSNDLAVASIVAQNVSHTGRTGKLYFNVSNGAAPAEAFSIAPNLAATFAGAVAIGNTVNTVSPTSPNRTVTMVIGGVTYYLAAKTTND